MLVVLGAVVFSTMVGNKHIALTIVVIAQLKLMELKAKSVFRYDSGFSFTHLLSLLTFYPGFSHINEPELCNVGLNGTSAG